MRCKKYEVWTSTLCSLLLAAILNLSTTTRMHRAAQRWNHELVRVFKTSVDLGSDLIAYNRRDRSANNDLRSASVGTFHYKTKQKCHLLHCGWNCFSCDESSPILVSLYYLRILKMYWTELPKWRFLWTSGCRCADKYTKCNERPWQGSVFSVFLVWVLVSDHMMSLQSKEYCSVVIWCWCLFNLSEIWIRDITQTLAQGSSYCIWNRPTLYITSKNYYGMTMFFGPWHYYGFLS